MAGAAVLAGAGYSVYVFVKRPHTEQLKSVKEWMLFAVTKAEKELGSGTGKLKLRYVYDMFIAKFPWLGGNEGDAGERQCCQGICEWSFRSRGDRKGAVIWH